MSALASFGERDARMILLIRALEEEPEQVHIPRARFEEATHTFARSMSKGDPGDAVAWSEEFLRPRAEWLYRSLVADQQVYRHFVDPQPFRRAVLWACFIAAALLFWGMERWMHSGYVEVVSPLVLIVLVWTWATVAWIAYELASRGPKDARESLSARVAAWLSRLFHRLPGARPVSALIVTRFEDLWMGVAHPVVGIRIRVALQACAMGAVVGMLIALALGGASRNVAVHWGTTWFKDGEALNYGAFRLMTWPGHLAYGALGGKPLTREEFLLLKSPADGSKSAAQGDPARGAQAKPPAGPPGGDREYNPVQKWFHTVALTLLLGALVPRAALAWLLLRRERGLNRSVALDLSEGYFQQLREQTVARLPGAGPVTPASPVPSRRCVWWKPWTWVRRRPVDR